MNNENLMEKIVALCKRRGFVYPSSDIYGGLANAYDYGPLGAELLHNIRSLWWNEFIQRREDMIGIDTQIILHPRTWVASGHVVSFNDPLVEDVVTHKRYRADHLIEHWSKKQENRNTEPVIIEDLNMQQMATYLKKHHITSPEGNRVTEPKEFNLLFETSLGVISGEKSKVYLRGETAQGIFSHFRNVVDTYRIQLPFGIGQIGKSFRNEITTGQFIFRTFEMEQAEIEYFFDPTEIDWRVLLKNWQQDMWNFVTKTLGISEKNLKWRRHTDKERSHYSKETYDLDYKYPFGFKELWGVAYRTDYDLKQHSSFSGKDLSYLHPVTQKKFIPHVIEPALGINRTFFMLLVDAYREEKTNDKMRVFLKLNPKLAPFKGAVFPLVSNKENIVQKAKEIYRNLKKVLNVTWDDRGNIGKRYFSQDEIGTPFCITIDYDTLKDDTVTVRDRDTTKQERISTTELRKYIDSRIRSFSTL
ncbi:glycine--tRNA ligase [Candidatus Roizmanbacteria bacterium RIFCSPHIGHO2_01_FULL_39_8]|uniref:glycine--tRNA ligase n=2 Tax=Candidatus Roizmaniibacteriota TaxID=1752723 RepID=A0A1F7GTU1_9BACT|nr:MAG: glycine--tRNA ligase [Candidatus Roizmanbacteria bacterium RIFCSPHIGHO2_01_FULL_39_8]OGK35079.1 MAG: glycine--tRNA ligase [Candidatus Roizmanbacteria bacterium RIFCSPHIGHO2_12_FULL_39_8]